MEWWLKNSKKKNEISSNGNLLPSRDTPQEILLKADRKDISVFLECGENFYLTEYIACIKWKEKGTIIKLVLSNLADVIEDIKVGH